MPEENPQEHANQSPKEQENSGTEAATGLVTLQVPFPETFIYSNIAAFSMSLMDMRIGFGEAMPDRTVRPRVGVVMAPEQAAVIALLLIGQVAQYEKVFGPLRDPRWRQFADQIASNEEALAAAQNKQDG